MFVGTKKLNQVLFQSKDDNFDLKKRFTSDSNNVKQKYNKNSVANEASIVSKRKNKIFHSKMTKLHYSFILIPFIIIIIILGIKLVLNPFSVLSNTKENQNDWSFNLNFYGTESCIRVYDIDQDGLDDFIFGIEDVKTEEGILMGVRGLDGSVLWNFTTNSEIFELNCLIDIDLDGRFDCIGTGRRHTMIAFDPHNGSIYWDSSFKINVNNSWNIYNPVILPYDLDNDGVNEVVISTGGNPNFPSYVHDRESGQIMLYSGKTGTRIGQELILPENKETYMSPVLFTQKDNSSFLLIGSGGETIPGYLYIISLPDFYNFISNKTYNFSGKYKSIEYLEKFQQESKIKGLYVLHKGSSKGVMVPPVLVDVNKDGTRDLLILSFDGVVLMLNGETFETIWSKKFECYETYTSPAPGYFDNDDILDFMLVQNFGTFSYYLNSSILILSGLNGSILWQMNTQRMQIISPLTIQTEAQYQDLFFFRAQGIIPIENKLQEIYHGVVPQQPLEQSPNQKEKIQEINEFNKCQNLIKKNKTEHSKWIEPNCENDNLDENLATYGILVDRSTQDAPISVFKTTSSKVVYKFTQKDLIGEEPIESVCIEKEPIERNTGAIGHFTSKNDLDVVTIISKQGKVRHPKSHNYKKIISELTIFKRSLANTILKNDKLNRNIYENLITKKLQQESKTELLENIKFKNTQTWAAYMGTYSDSSV